MHASLSPSPTGSVVPSLLPGDVERAHTDSEEESQTPISYTEGSDIEVEQDDDSGEEQEEGSGGEQEQESGEEEAQDDGSEQDERMELEKDGAYSMAKLSERLTFRPPLDPEDDYLSEQMTNLDVDDSTNQGGDSDFSDADDVVDVSESGGTSQLAAEEGRTTLESDKNHALQLTRSPSWETDTASLVKSEALGGKEIGGQHGGDSVHSEEIVLAMLTEDAE